MLAAVLIVLLVTSFTGLDWVTSASASVAISARTSQDGVQIVLICTGGLSLDL